MRRDVEELRESERGEASPLYEYMLDLDEDLMDDGIDDMFSMELLGSAPEPFVRYCGLLAHLWGAYVIPMALSVIFHVLSVSTITTRNN